MSEENKAVVRRFFDEVVNGRELDVVDELFAEDFTLSIPFSPEPLAGPESMTQTVSGFHTAFPDLDVAVEVMVAEGDTVATRVTASGTNDGEMMGMPPTNRRAAWSVIHMMTVRDGAIVEDRVHMDRAGLMEQLGQVPVNG